MVGMCLALAACSDAQRLEDPINLSKAKAAVSQYCDSGAYDREIAEAVARARLWIEERASNRKPGERLAIVLDVDETAISNAPLIRRLDFAFIPSEWETWTRSGLAPAIMPVLKLYQRTRELGISVFFVTGRKAAVDRERTELNLRTAGMGDYERLILADYSEPSRTSAERKLAHRKALIAEGWILIANIGDQESDLRGAAAEKGFKLPNPFYLME
jgi:acid phosphatase